MRIFKRTGPAVLAAYAFSALAVSSASAAPLFLAHPPGGLLLAVAGGVQKFVTVAGSIECTVTKLIAPGDVAPVTLRSLSILLVVSYSGCKAFGLILTLHPFRYRIDANGLVTLENTVLGLAGAGTCTITMPAGQNLHRFLFTNNATTRGILITNELTGFTSSGSGPSCSYSEESNGVWTGTWHIVMHGGTLRWDP
jgi:hypothetical protein